MNALRLLTYAAAFGVACITAGLVLAFGAYEGTQVSYSDRVRLLVRMTWDRLTGE